ncbi:LytR/AlgR family response regulator transcription factor [Haloimpatiens sp. FM7330]|uniref:LytR/AlgR family response regulator transcription factor n=1 Tax=Haloimpatiens sp. FM7330 TaxID=3298610 RepID=UPI003644448D
MYYCKACERETLVYTRSKCFSANCSISEFYKKLNENNFFKSHRSYIVNLDKISEIIPWFNNTFIVKFPNLDVEIPVSRNNISEFKHLMGI